MTGDLRVSRVLQVPYRRLSGTLARRTHSTLTEWSWAVVRTLQFDARAAIAMPLNRERKREGRD